MNLLVVDDDAETLELVGRAFTREGHRVLTAESIHAAKTRLAERDFDVIVLDVMLPDGSGLELCAKLREEGCATPILFLSARGTVSSKVDGLDAGGDDYLPKPFAVRELTARVKALGRRAASLPPSVLKIGSLEFDFAHRRAERDGVEIPLTTREWDVIIALAGRRGRAMSFDDLLETAWGESTEAARASLEVIIARLRRKLDLGGGTSVIRTMRGFGYALATDG